MRWVRMSQRLGEMPQGQGAHASNQTTLCKHRHFPQNRTDIRSEKKSHRKWHGPAACSCRTQEPSISPAAHAGPSEPRLGLPGCRTEGVEEGASTTAAAAAAAGAATRGGGGGPAHRKGGGWAAMGGTDPLLPLPELLELGSEHALPPALTPAHVVPVAPPVGVALSKPPPLTAPLVHTPRSLHR
eukprot:1148955-Pelagomonas_calceolata.AAC.4